MPSHTWACQTPDGTTYHDDERAAERAASELVKSKNATVAVVYRIDIQGESA